MSYPRIKEPRNQGHLLEGEELQYWQVKSSLGTVGTRNGPLLSLKADDDPQMSLKFPTITSFIVTVEVRHPQSKTEEGDFGSVQPQWNVSSPTNIVRIKT